MFNFIKNKNEQGEIMKKLLIAILMSVGYSQTVIVWESDFVGDTVVVVGDYNIAKSNTPVSYTDINKEQIETFEGQDIAYHLSNVPGVYIRNDLGVKSQTNLWVRGFDEQRLSVSINNIPINDPTSKKVWWSNWGSTSQSTNKIQVQRGVSSSLYGLGNLGGSVHIITDDSDKPETNFGYSTWNGDSRNLKFSVNKTAENYTTRFTYLRDYGYKVGSYFESLAYYLSVRTNYKGHNLRLVFHGSPALNTLGFYGQSPSTFAKYGRNYSGNVQVSTLDVPDSESYLTLSDVVGFAKGGTSNSVGSFINAGGRSSLDNNAYHKPMLELHHSYTFDNGVELNNDLHYSWGNGFLALLDKFYFVSKDENGLMSYESVNAGAPWYPNLHQYTSWVDHKQFGQVLTLSKTLNKDSKIYAGFDNRVWISDHKAYINNGFGGDEYYYNIGGVPTGFPEGGKIWDFTTYKPQSSFFVRYLQNIGKFSVLADLQRSSITYEVEENMISTNNTTGKLITWDKKFTSWSPKLGVVYTHNNDLSTRLSVSKTENEPRIRAMFNYGKPKEDITLEEAIDTEFGVKYKNSGLNIYNIDFRGKNMLVVNPEMANTDDYDYQGRKYIPIGDANYSGIELYTTLELPYGLALNLNYSKSKNVWGTPFGEEGRSILYGFDVDSTIGDTRYETGFPQTILSGNLSYKWKDLTVVVSSRYYDDIYIMENNSEVSVDGHNDENGEWVSTEDSATLPSSFLTDLSIKYGVSKNLDVQLQVHNLLNTEYWSSASSWGFQTGIPRSSTFSLFYRF